MAQDTFMKVFKNLASFKGDCSFSTWIYRIAYNTAISSVRKKRYEFLAIEETTLENVSEEEVTDKPNPRNRFKDWKSPLNNFYRTNGP